MACAECARLLAEREGLKQAYALAVDLFFATGYLVTDVEYLRLKNYLEEARVQAEVSRANLDQHKLAVHSKAG